MSSVYVLRKNASLNMSPNAPPSVQLNVGGEGKKINYSEMSPAAAKWGRRARYAAAVPAAWSALSTLAGDGREDLFTTLGQAGLSASATHNIARGALEPAAARFAERRNFKNNPSHYKDGKYVGPPSENSSGTINAEFTEEDISPTQLGQLPENTTGTIIASPEGKPQPPIEMIQKPDGSFGYSSTDNMHEEAVNQNSLLQNNPVLPPPEGATNQNNEDPFQTSMNFMDQSRRNMNNSNYGQ